MLDTARITGLADSALVLSLGHVGVFQGICTAAQLSDSAQAAIFDVLHRGSRPDLDSVLTTLELNEGFCQAFIALLDFRGGAKAFNTIEEVLAALQRTHPGIRVVIDLAELRGYRYHNGMLYAAFTDKGEAIAQGGRYDSVGTAFGRDRPATGFSGDLTQLARLAAAAAPHENSSPKDGVYVPATKALSANDEAALWDTVNALRASGERVVMALPDDASHAASCRCERELRLTDGQWHVEPAQR